MQNITAKTTTIFTALVVLMAITRAYHFGSVLHLPDASLAVFFLAGIYLPRWTLPLLLIEAGLVDYAAIQFGGVSGWCFSPAYWFLIPTYAVLWVGGRFYQTRSQFTLGSLLDLLTISVVVTSLAFVISNLSFYVLSDNYQMMSASQYAEQVAQYFIPYLQSALLYLSIAVLCHFIVMRSQVQFSR